MDLILCHTTADFDTLGAAIGLSRLLAGARVVLTGGAHPTVREFLALHRDEYALIERRAVREDQVRTLTVVDTQWRDRLGKAAEWLDLPDVDITVYDHHQDAVGDIATEKRYVEAVGATATLIAEQLQAAQISLTSAEATVMALGIHVDTGSLTFDHTTVRDAAALTWLMGQGANLRAIAEYVEPGLSPQLQDLLTIALNRIQVETIRGIAIASLLLPQEGYVQGLSQLASHLVDLTETNILLLAVCFPITDGEKRLNIIARLHGSPSAASQLEGINLGKLLEPLGGGGHSRAAAATLRTSGPEVVLAQLTEQIKAEIPHPPTARELMSSPVRTIRPETTIAEAQRILLRYGHSGLSVVDEQDQLVGVISRRDIDLALHHGFSHAPVKGYMATNLKTIDPDTPLSEIQSLMVTYDVGRLPVLDHQQLVGIVTRTDVLRQLQQDGEQGVGDWELGIGQRGKGDLSEFPVRGRRLVRSCPLPEVVKGWLSDRLTPSLWEVLAATARLAEQRGWQLYLVGGAVRDLLLAPEKGLLIQDIDLVVDGFHRTADEAAGVELARDLRQTYPEARLQIHGRFQTAALLWHDDSQLDSLWIDIATARTEFYPYPAANPEVEASSIRQDLYRRDFTINAMAIRLTAPRSGELLDFFGGLLDLQAQQIRVLHTNSFIEDPTRIFRAVRFAVRLGFQIDPQTEGYIRHAIASGIYQRIQTEVDKTPALQTRLKQELKYILQAPYWKAAIQLLSELEALQCIHPDLQLSDRLWKQLQLADRWLNRFDPAASLEHWQMLLEVLLMALDPADRGKVAENLQLAADSIQRLWQLEQIEAALATLPNLERPSQVVQQLRQYDWSTLLLVAIASPHSIRKIIWRYRTTWAQMKAPLDGNDLKALGYKPGQQFKEILEALLLATLDGMISDRDQAVAFLAEHFPQ
ncbi:CBS domain-containing protein [Cyanobacteria bacterium FACHB-471]|nr:CBS domain-containing protein [Cyanobacteria bacterium FACHB-471]